ncbi:DUF1661 domain-containing protein [Porphyromonas gulae]|uniref:DUF1661 domain-containing protein n=1 Tax=Porphyromonas gulae TaxID=111105 RepID=UPI0009B87297|nr:DUF1661 domain-containing protein [Porphyromonas gulae]
MAREAKNSRTKTEKKSRAFFKKHVRKISGFWFLKSFSPSLSIKQKARRNIHLRPCRNQALTVFSIEKERSKFGRCLC